MNRPLVTVGIVAVAVLVVAAIVYSFYRPASVPPESGPVATSAERAQDARDYIAKIEQDPKPNYTEAVQRAEEFRSKGQLADAQLLYFFAARNGNAEAAFELAQLYDPNHFEPGSSLMGEPDAFQAFKWYTAAKNGGVGEAQARLDALHEWAEKAAENGDTEAERLLLQWQ
jgi:TPR repeat protein